jgi:hypothetical protein
LGLGQRGAPSRSCLLAQGARVSPVLQPQFDAFSLGTFLFDVKAVS